MSEYTKRQRVIEPSDYTSQIERVVTALKRRMDSTFIKYSADDDIIAVEDGSMVYVLANPVLGKEALYDELGEIKELVSIRNITTIWSDDWQKYDPDLGKFVVKQPRTRILRPDLCMKILPDGTIVDGGNASGELVPSTTPYSDRLMFDALFEVVS